MARRLFDIVRSFRREDSFDEKKPEYSHLGDSGKNSMLLQPLTLTTASVNHYAHHEASRFAAFQSDGKKQHCNASRSLTHDQSYKANHPTKSCQPFSAVNLHITADSTESTTSLSLSKSTRSFSEICPSDVVFPNNEIESTTRSTNDGDLYREPVAILGALCNSKPVYKYPHSEPTICESLKMMLPDLTDALWAQIDDNPQLAGYSTEIEVQLLMCTIQPDLQSRAAYPAVIITCDKKIGKDLKELLLGRAMKKYNLLWPTRSRGDFDSHSCRIHIENIVGAPSRNLGGLFDISTVQAYLWQSDFVDDDTYCGTRVVTDDDKKLAAIACIIKSGSDFFGLTAAHAFKDLLANENATYSMSKQSIRQEQDNRNGITPSHREIQIIIPSITNDCTSRDYDWALIPLSTIYPPKMNSFFIKQHERVLLEEAVDCHPGTERKVSIIPSQRHEIKGVLLCGNVYRQLSPRAKVAELWSVQLGDEDLTEGDSGSLVIDTETYEIYGHVVSLSHDRKVHIVPFFRTAEQVRHIFNSTAIGLPSITDAINIELPISYLSLTKETLDDVAGIEASLSNVVSDTEVLNHGVLAALDPPRTQVKAEVYGQAGLDEDLDGRTEKIELQKNEDDISEAIHSRPFPINTHDGISSNKAETDKLKQIHVMKLDEPNTSAKPQTDPLIKRVQNFGIDSGKAFSSQAHILWFCCECDEGPKKEIYERTCIGCGHRRCFYCKTSMATKKLSEGAKDLEKGLISMIPTTIINQLEFQTTSNDIETIGELDTARIPKIMPRSLTPASSATDPIEIPQETSCMTPTDESLIIETSTADRLTSEPPSPEIDMFPLSKPVRKTSIQPKKAKYYQSRFKEELPVSGIALFLEKDTFESSGKSRGRPIKAEYDLRLAKATTGEEAWHRPSNETKTRSIPRKMTTGGFVERLNHMERMTDRRLSRIATASSSSYTQGSTSSSRTPSSFYQDLSTYSKSSTSSNQDSSSSVKYSSSSSTFPRSSKLADTEKRY